MNKHTTMEGASLAQIRQAIAALQERERVLTARAAAMYKAGQTGSPEVIDERRREVDDGARDLLEGLGLAGLLPNEPERKGFSSELEVLTEREKVRKALAVLQRARDAAEAIEAEAWAAAHRPEWLALVRDCLLSAARCAAVHARAADYLERAGNARYALPACNLGAGDAQILTGMNDCWGMISLRELLDAAVEAEVVTAGDLKKARSV